MPAGGAGLWRTARARPALSTRIGALLATALLAAGCASVPRKPTVSVPWPQSRARLQSLASFALKGKVGVAAGGEGFNASLQWEQQGRRSAVALDGPLGIGGVRIVADGSTLNVRNSRGQELDSDAARQELDAKLGFDPPLASLRYWVLGVPDPAQPASETLGSDQRLAALDQDGWHIDYASYMQANADWLPQRLTLTRGNVRVRLVVLSWRA
jgi:outer membrane lipoprotein LolB